MRNGSFVTFDRRMMFVYSSHSTRDRAENALDDYFANGEISLGERPIIACMAGAWRVLFPAN